MFASRGGVSQTEIVLFRLSTLGLRGLDSESPPVEGGSPRDGCYCCVLVTVGSTACGSRSMKLNTKTPSRIMGKGNPNSKQYLLYIEKGLKMPVMRGERSMEHPSIPKNNNPRD